MALKPSEAQHLGESADPLKPPDLGGSPLSRRSPEPREVPELRVSPTPLALLKPPIHRHRCHLGRQFLRRDRF